MNAWLRVGMRAEGIKMNRQEANAVLSSAAALYKQCMNEQSANSKKCMNKQNENTPGT